uniref:Uncharacterized protein n=1 Tax=Solanum lycopersicum TaxID=4081 RepID=A0A3Q7F3F1_SOLLC
MSQCLLRKQNPSMPLWLRNSIKLTNRMPSKMVSLEQR